jgi:hypothetical protein
VTGIVISPSPLSLSPTSLCLTFFFTRRRCFFDHLRFDETIAGEQLGFRPSLSLITSLGAVIVAHNGRHTQTVSFLPDRLGSSPPLRPALCNNFGLGNLQLFGTGGWVKTLLRTSTMQVPVLVSTFALLAPFVSASSNLAYCASDNTGSSFSSGK